MTRDEALSLALGLPEAAAHPHFDRTAVRAGKGRIFATFGAGGDMNVKLGPDEQALFVDLVAEVGQRDVRPERCAGGFDAEAAVNGTLLRDLGYDLLTETFPSAAAGA